MIKAKVFTEKSNLPFWFRNIWSPNFPPVGSVSNTYNTLCEAKDLTFQLASDFKLSVRSTSLFSFQFLNHSLLKMSAKCCSMWTFPSHSARMLFNMLSWEWAPVLSGIWCLLYASYLMERHLLFRHRSSKPYDPRNCRLILISFQKFWKPLSYQPHPFPEREGLINDRRCGFRPCRFMLQFYNRKSCTNVFSLPLPPVSIE